jgi:hypothetical protein
MPFNITVLPPGNAAKAQETFLHLIHDKPLVLLVVMGDDEDAEGLKARAVLVAGGPEDLRRVVWMKNPDNHRQQIAALESSEMLKGKDVLAFTTSHDDAVCDVIERSEAPVKFGRIIDSFAAGEE